MAHLLNKRERVILYLLAGLIILALGFNLLLEPFLSRNESLNREISLQRHKFIKYSKLLREKEGIISRYRNFSLPSGEPGQNEDTLVSMLTEIEGLAKTSGLRIVEIRPESEPSAGRDKGITIMLRTEAGIEGYFKFLYSLEDSVSILTVNKILLTAKGASGILEGSINLSQLKS